MKSTDENYDIMYKIVLIGDSSVGKTNIMSIFVRNDFNIESKPTIGVEFSNRNIIHEGKKIKIQVWDTAGQERYRAITGAYYKGAVGAMLIYDITKKSTFDNLERWLKELNDHANTGVVCLLIGNKSDLNYLRVVKQEEAMSYAKKKGFGFFETSALESYNVNEAFKKMIDGTRLNRNICQKNYITKRK